MAEERAAEGWGEGRVSKGWFSIGSSSKPSFEANGFDELEDGVNSDEKAEVDCKRVALGRCEGRKVDATDGRGKEDGRAEEMRWGCNCNWNCELHLWSRNRFIGGIEVAQIILHESRRQQWQDDEGLAAWSRLLELFVDAPGSSKFLDAGEGSAKT